MFFVDEEKREDDAQQEGADAAPNEALPGLLRRHLDEGRLAEEHAEDVGEDVIGDDHRRRDQEPTKQRTLIGHWHGIG